MSRFRNNLTALLSLWFFLPGCSQAIPVDPKAEDNMVLHAEEAKVSEDLQETSEKRYWVCPDCTNVESKVLRALQDEGITDKYALAVVMGNIKQESKFELTVCEGGAKTGYANCRRGGFGLIQWTTDSRYRGLGRVARQYQLDPNSLEAQLKWLFTEVEWKRARKCFVKEGQSFDYYMRAAYKWLGWGVKGARAQYAQEYAKMFVVNS